MSSRASYPSLKGRSVFVSGGGSGIGAQIVRRFCEQGSKVAFVDIDRGSSEELVAALAARATPTPLFLPLRPARHRGAARGGAQARARPTARSPCWSTTPPATTATRSTR